ncbi:MAG TPA: acyltransferase [Mycobacteriales bacterium]|nr:acyltransferase [Mycobacteriales bacterium]
MRRSVAVDALRGVAVLLVLLHHLDIGVLVGGSVWLLPVKLLHEAGFLGVSLFLVLSGFSIHLRVASGGSFAARPFLLRRFVRLQPTYYVALGAALLLAAVAVVAGQPWPQPRWGLPGTPIPVWALLLTHLSVLAGTIVPPGWLSITWSLALEEQIYLLYAAVVGRLRRVPAWRWLLAALAACLAYRLAAELVLPSVPKSFPPGDGRWSWAATAAFQQVPARMAEWFTGALIAQWWAGTQRLPRALSGRASVPALAAAALGVLLLMFTHRAGWTTLAGHRFAFTDVLFDPWAGLAFGALLVCCLAGERRAERPGATATGLAWLGERSYSMYLAHAPIVGTTFALAGGLLGTVPGRLAVCGLAVALSVAGTVLLYRYVEAPCTARSKRVGVRTPVAVG